MKSSHDQSQPGRVIAEIGGRNHPSTLFLVERQAEPETDESDDSERFFIRDADDMGGTLATARVDHIDHSAGEADMDLRVRSRLDDPAYRLTVSNMREALSAMLHEAGVDTVHLDSNLSQASLEQMGCQATNSVVEFSLPEETAVAA